MPPPPNCFFFLFLNFLLILQLSCPYILCLLAIYVFSPPLLSLHSYPNWTLPIALPALAFNCWNYGTCNNTWLLRSFGSLPDSCLMGLEMFVSMLFECDSTLFHNAGFFMGFVYGFFPACLECLPLHLCVYVCIGKGRSRQREV